jgi:hypothetical protein
MPKYLLEIANPVNSVGPIPDLFVATELFSITRGILQQALAIGVVLGQHPAKSRLFSW